MLCNIKTNLLISKKHLPFFMWGLLGFEFSGIRFSGIRFQVFPVKCLAFQNLYLAKVVHTLAGVMLYQLFVNGYRLRHFVLCE